MPTPDERLKLTQPERKKKNVGIQIEKGIQKRQSIIFGDLAGQEAGDTADTSSEINKSLLAMNKSFRLLKTTGKVDNGESAIFKLLKVHCLFYSKKNIKA